MPNPDITPLHSITRSARATTDSGILTPSAAAVLRFRASSKAAQFAMWRRRAFLVVFCGGLVMRVLSGNWRLTLARNRSHAIMCSMIRAVVIAALLGCQPAIVRGEDRPKMSSDGRVQGIFCSSPKDHSDCIEACALRLKEIERYRACTAACTSLYCPRK